MKNEYSSDDLKKLEDKIDRLQKSVNKLEKNFVITSNLLIEFMNHLEVPYQKSKTFSVKTSMLSFALKVLFSGLIIAFASWLSVKKPILAGFIIALPLMSLISIFFSYLEHKDMEKTITFSKSILVGVPASFNIFHTLFFC